ncbi:nucleotidyltransferase family protein [Bradyrhizobium daqingense]|uniref:CBS domain protein n=1 Tax=Bradyrhizobium daqingense TaxID=993502 RepID=A0A562LQH5_9BRAD|nr:nucleotidyltransferase family protein [Bradyrhizobium daqingense]TWI09884.1 CBS domain protein [Bradyrhizobium daqingense]UFS88200.1 nucleotidyltransferase family protein [Bradyrhizobium daqingense]
MKSWQKAIVGTEATVSEAIAAIESGSIQIALVLDNGRLAGIVTDGDIRRGLLRGIPLTGRATDMMNANPVSASVTLPRDERLRLMRQRSIKQLPLLDANGHVIGVETFDELLEAPRYENPVLIMAGGLGERLGVLTREMPKPMLHVGGRPLLETIVRNFVQQGFRNIFISVNYKAELIQNHFGDGASFGAAIRYVHEAQRLGTAGALGLLPSTPDLPLVVTNGDILTTINYGALVDFHNATPADATMAVREHKVHVPYGVVTAAEGYLQVIREKPTESWFVSAGIYVIGPTVFRLVDRGVKIDMPAVLERVVASEGRVAVYPIREYWLDIGRVEDFEQAHAEFHEVFQ